MDSIIPLEQKNTLAGYMILSDADNRPPMLDKDLYDSWKNRMELYMQNREYGRMILELFENGPLIWPTIKENGVIRTKNMLNCPLLRKFKLIVIRKLQISFFKNFIEFTKPGHYSRWQGYNATISRETRSKLFEYKSNATSFVGNNSSGQARVVKCYNYQGEGHMATQCSQPKQPRNASWYKEKAMLAEAQEARQILDEEQLAFLADLGVSDDDMIKEKLALKEQVDSLEQNISKQIKEKECLLQTFTAFKRKSKEKEAKNIENEIDLKKKIKELDNIIFKVGQSAHTVHMLTKPHGFNDNIHKQALCYQNPFYLKKAQRIKPTLYDADETLRYHMLNPSTKSSDALPVKIEAPKELPKVSLVNESLKKLKLHLDNFDKVVKIRTTPNARTEAQLHDKDSTICKLKDIIKSMREKSKDKNVNYDYVEIETKNVKLENSVTKLISENERLCNKINHVKQVFKEQFDSIKRTRVYTKEQSDSLVYNLNLKFAENDDLKSQIQDKVFVITSLKNDLRRIKRTKIVDIAAQKPSANTIVPGMFKLDLEPLAPSAKKVVVTPKNNVKKVRFAEPLTSSSNIKHVDSSTTSDSNTPVLSPTGLKCATSNCGSNSLGNKKSDRISQTPSRNMKNKVESQPRNVNKKNRVVEPIRIVDVKQLQLNENSKLFLLLKPTSHVFTEVGFKWKPTGRTFTTVGNSCPLTRITSANVVPPKKTTSYLVESQIPELKVYSRKPKNVIYVGCPDCSLVSGLWMFKTHDKEPLSAHELSGKCYYLKSILCRGLGHNVFSVGQFCDTDLEVALWKNTCFIRNLEGVDLISGSRDTNLYTISLNDMLKTYPICLLSKASKSKSWLWHLRLSYLKFSTLNKLAKDGLARGIPRLKFQKDHLCSACSLGKSKKSSHQPKAEDTNQEKLYLLHIDLCGPMRMASINGKSYILMIVGDYSRFTWVRFLRSKDEAPEAIIKCIKKSSAVDPTLFTWKAGNNLSLVQIYVENIIFASTNTAMCNEFSNLMTTKCKMLMMEQSDSVDTPLVEKSKLDEDLQGKPVDATLYRGMIGSRMYLTSS
nr:retrovirus-related Pol polyprotein from transposon TNT 1-94 [Tanacetum cinerariifolium]